MQVNNGEFLERISTGRYPNNPEINMRMSSGEQSIFLGGVMEIESIRDGPLVVVEFP